MSNHDSGAIGQGGIRYVDIWPQPGPISPVPKIPPYPIDCFPRNAREGCLEFQRFCKSPLAMVGSAALAQMALAAQGLADVGRDEVLIGPLSLNVLIVAQSGERKTAIDSAFSKAARQWERDAREDRGDAFRRAKAMEKSRFSRIEGVRQKIKAVAGKENDEAKKELDRLESRLADLEANEIFVPPLPHLFYEDATPEGLAYSLADGWPSAALVSDEAGLVVGGKGMAEDAALGFLTLLNRLWDGRPFQPVRKTAKTKELRGRRFSSSLMLQQELLQQITQRGGRGVGFFGRFLIAAPPTAMGQRLYTAPPPNMPALTKFNERIQYLLSCELPTNDDGHLEPPIMMANQAARECWREYHDAVEVEMSEFGEFALVRDVAAKSAENAARIAGVFQVFEQGPGGALLAEYMEAGIAIAAWHLTEANRLFFESDKPEEIKDAELLSDWLTTAGIGLFKDGRLPLGKILQMGPYRLRSKESRDRALMILQDEEICHLRIIENGRAKMLEVNPYLLNKKLNQKDK